MVTEDTKSGNDKGASFSFAPNEAQNQLEFTLQSLIDTYGKKRVLKVLKTLQITSKTPE
tara:strand:+ start:168 stop:344 length:177 start_codon:yes stop_codon:yes gene_type:complete